MGLDVREAQRRDLGREGGDVLPEVLQGDLLRLVGQRVDGEHELAGDGGGDALEAVVVGAAVARFCGTITSASPTMSTTWKATATAAQSLQLAAAKAPLVLSTVSSVTHTIATATS